MALTLEEIRSYIPELRDKPVSDIVAVMEQNGFDTSAIAQEETAQPEESGLLRSYVGIPLLKGVSGVGSAVGYGLEASGIAPETGRAIQESGDELNRTLTERQSKQAQEDAQKKLIDENGNYGGYNAGTFVQQATESLPAMAAMALPGGLLTKALTPIAGGLVGSSIGFGASEGAFSGAQNASQIQQEIRSADFETLLQHPEFKRTVEQETSPELSMDDRLMIARDIVARKAGDQVFADTFVKTGGISSVTGGGMLGALGRGGYTGGLATRMAKGFGNEGILQEAPQSALEQQTINQAKKDYLNPNQDTNEGVLTSGLEGGLVGGVLGAAGGFKANVEDIAKAPTVDDAIKAASDAVEGGPTWTKPEAKDIKNPWSAPEFKDIPDAEKIVQNRTLPGAPLQDFIDSQYQSSGYTPSEQVWERPNIEQVQGQADKNRAFYEAEQAAIQQKQDELAAMERNPDASPAQVKQYRKKRIELQLQKRKNAELFRQGLGFNIVPMQAGEVKNDQLSTQLTRALNEQKVAEATGGGTGEGKRIPPIVNRKRRLESPDDGTVGLPSGLPEQDQRAEGSDVFSPSRGVGSLDEIPTQQLVSRTETSAMPSKETVQPIPETGFKADQIAGINQSSNDAVQDADILAPQPAAQDANPPAARTPAPSVPEAQAEPMVAPKAEDYKSAAEYHAARLAFKKNPPANNEQQIEKNKRLNELNGEIKKAKSLLEKRQTKGDKAFSPAQARLDAKLIKEAEDKLTWLEDERNKLVSPQLDSILTVSKKRYLYDQKRAYNKANPNAIKSAKDKAYADMERNYDDDLLKAEVSLPFEQYRQRNPDLTENLARQTYDQVREELGLNEKRTADLPVQETPLDEQAVVQSEKVLPAGAGTEKVPEANTEATEIKASDDKSESQLNKPKPKQSAINDKDDLLAAIAKLGGLNRNEAKAQGIDPASFNKRGYGIMRVFTKGGKSYDEMAELLRGYYFDAPTANDLVDQVSRAINQGEKIYTPVGYEIKAELIEQERLSDEEARRVINYQSLLETAKQHDADFGTNYLDILLAKEDMDYDDINAWEEDFYNDRQERIKESLADSETALSSYTEQDIKDREQAGQQREKQAQSDRVKAEADKEFDSVFDEMAATAPKTQDVFGMSDPLEKVSEPEEKPEAAKKSQTQRKVGLTKVQVLAHIAKKYRKLKPLVDNGTVVVYDTFEDVPAEIRGDGMASKSMPDKIAINGVDRWTMNSNGQPIAQTEEGIRNFWQWFGNSKIVDEQGRPLVVYHSALDDKTQFDKHGKFMGYTGVSGISLTDSKEMASRYLDRFGQYRYDGKPFEKNILALYARAENPLYRNEPFKSGVVLGAPLPDGYISPVEKMGHDALIRNDAISRGGGVKHSTAKNAIRGREIVVFSPNQIKSAIGNTGAFDPNNNDIRYSTPGKSQNPVKIEGFTYKGKIYLIADALSPETIDGVIHHEFFHKVIADNPKIRNRLLGAQSDLRGIMRQVEAGRYRGRYKEIYDAAMDRAKKAGTTSEQEKLEEFLAYSVSKYLDNPQSLPERLARIIKDIIAAIKLAIFKMTGKITDISPADLTAMARSSMRVSEDGGGGMKSSKLALPDKITIDGIERWTVNSNGQPIAQTEEGIKNFWKWFSGSHATDKQGRPLVVFHGSNQEQLNEFDTSAVGDEYNQDSRGFFFTDDKEEAESYARNTSYGLPRETKGAVVSAYLKLKSPLIKNIDFDPISEWDDNHESFQKEAFGKNADGIIIKAQKYQSMYVAFEPTQIKSIDNSGAFDPANPDIRYSLAEDTTREELNRRIREQHKTVSDRAKQWFTREFHPGGALPKSVFTLKVARDSEINAEELIAHNLVAMLDKSVKAAWGGRMTEEQKQLVGARLKGEEVSLPASVKDSIDAMRLHIDKLSARYADILFKEAEELQEADKTEAAAAKVQLLNTIANNIGSYVNRSYRAFDNENWAKQVPDDVLNNARDYLEERFRSKGSVTPIADAQRTINDILKTGTAYDTFEQYIRESKLGAKDLSVLIKRKDIAPEIRALLGEYTDPRINFVKSATKMSRLIFNDDFLKQVKTTGLGADGFLFTKDNRPADEHTVKIAADSSSPMAPLNGLYTYPEINQAFVDALNKESMESWYRMIVQANGLVKYGKTVLSPTTSFRNWMSAYFFTLANGHFDLSHMKESIESFKTYFDQDNGRLHYLEKLKRLGVIYDTPYAGEMMALLADSKFESALMGEDGRFSKAKLKVKDWMDLATKFYQFGDDFWKIIGFENEKQILKKYRGLTDAQAEVEAAKRIRNTYPTYSMVGRMIQKLRRFPLVGTFVSFPAEIIRTSFNILKYAKEDMAYSKELGMRRIAGIAMVSGFAYAAQALAMSLTGTDDHDEEALRDLAPPWSKNSNIIPMGRDKNGSLIYIDMSFLDPYNYFKRPLNAILRGQPIDETAYEIGREILTPFFGQDIAFGAISDIWQNKKDSGGQVFNPNDSALNIGVDIANHLRKNLQPGIVSNMERMTYALTGHKSTSGQTNTVAEELAALAGFRASRVNPKVALYYRSYEFQDKLKDASKILNDVARDPNRVSDSRLKSAYELAIETRSEAFKDMHELVSSAENAGLSKAAIRKLLKLNHVSQKNINFILLGKEPKWVPGETFLKSSIAKSDELFDAETTKEFERRRKLILSGKE